MPMVIQGKVPSFSLIYITNHNMIQSENNIRKRLFGCQENKRKKFQKKEVLKTSLRLANLSWVQTRVSQSLSLSSVEISFLFSFPSLSSIKMKITRHPDQKSCLLFCSQAKKFSPQLKLAKRIHRT